MALRGQVMLDDRVGAIRMRRTVLADRAMHEAEILKQQEPSLVVQPIERFIARILLQFFRYLANVVLRHRPGRCDAFELVEQVSVL